MKKMMILLMTLLEFQILFHHHLHPVINQQPLHSNFQSNHPWLKPSNLHLKTPIPVLFQRFQHHRNLPIQPMLHPNLFPHQQPILIHQVQLLDVKIGKQKGSRECCRICLILTLKLGKPFIPLFQRLNSGTNFSHFYEFGPTVTSRHHHPP